MLAQLESDDLKFMDRVYINFTLGKAFEDSEKFDQAFAHYAAGNKAKKAQSRYSAEQMTEEFEQQKQLFTPQFVSDRQGLWTQCPRPYLCRRPTPRRLNLTGADTVVPQPG